MSYFAVIDTETNWADQVMSIGAVIADEAGFSPIGSRYYILPTECQIGGMYEKALFLDTPEPPLLLNRQEALSDLRHWLRSHGVRSLFAYNACFDRNHLPELRDFLWHDIMRLAAYRQYNRRIPECAECFSTGRMKRGYSVESMLQILSGHCGYRETHNAFFDAQDELRIMQFLGFSPAEYPAL